METRSKTRVKTTKQLDINIDIDFDEASDAWRQNKKHVGQGHFKYVCSALKKDGNICGKSCFTSNGNKTNEYCWSHRSYNKDKI
jgi:hypothetical protein